MRITRKLALLVAVPLVAVVAFAGLAVVTSAGEAAGTERLRLLVAAAAAAGDLGHHLQAERAAAVLVLTTGSDEEADGFAQAVTASREAQQRFDRHQGRLAVLPAGTAALLDRVGDQLTGLRARRDQVAAGRGAASAAAFAYRIVIADLVEFRESVAQAGGAPAELAGRLRAAAALSRAAEQVGRQQVAVLRAVGYGTLSPAAAQEVTAARTGHVESALTFDALATPDWRARWEQSATGDEALAAQRLEDDVARTAPGARLRLDPAAWAQAQGGRMARLREVEAHVDADLAAEVTALRDAQRRLAALQSAAVLAAVLVAIGLAIGLGRPVVRGLGRLRDAAHAVAYRELPAAVSRLDDHAALGGLTPEEFADRAPAPVHLRGRDELTEVGAAFNAVHREALRTAAGQALLRVHVAAMFVNLARRGQSLAGRLTAALDEAERDEQDPARLRQLFTLDHLVTLLGRTNDSLLVLGGAAPAQVRLTDEPLAVVITAAQGQVEDYPRIETGVVDAGVVIPAAVVDDVVKLLAELLDNACRYSAPDQPVRVDARWLADRVVVQITDNGIGVEAARRDALNQRLASRPALDLAAVRTMGLTVVGHLAARHGIGVQLRPGPGGGTIAEITLPPGVFLVPEGSAVGLPPAPPAPTDQPTQPWPVLDRSATPHQPPSQTPATQDTVRLAIFEQVRSGWFTPAGQPSAAPDRPGTAIPGQPPWRTAADPGWQAAARASVPAPAGVTPNGLPRRSPGAQLVPGGVPEPPAGEWRDPARVSAALAAYSRGLASGRARRDQHPTTDQTTVDWSAAP